MPDAGIGNRLRSLREAAGLSQIGAARRIGVDKSTMSLWEAGKRVPSLAFLVKIADIFHVSIDYLVGRYRGEK